MLTVSFPCLTQGFQVYKAEHLREPERCPWSPVSTPYLFPNARLPPKLRRNQESSRFLSPRHLPFWVYECLAALVRLASSAFITQIYIFIKQAQDINWYLRNYILCRVSLSILTKYRKRNCRQFIIWVHLKIFLVKISHWCRDKLNCSNSISVPAKFLLNLGHRN